MSALWRPTVVVSSLIAVVLLATLAAYLEGTQSAARDDIVEAFGKRATLTARLTSGALNSNTEANRAFARATFRGSPADVQAAVETDVKQDPQPRVIVLGERGRILGGFPRGLKGDRELIDQTPALRFAMAGRVAFSDVFETAQGPTLLQAVPFTVGGERRVWGGGFPASRAADFAHAFLSSALSVAGGDAYLVDGAGRIIATTAQEATGDPLPASLWRAVIAGRSGTLGDDVYVSADVQTSSWRVVFVAHSDALMAPIQSTRRAAWWLFTVLAAAMLVLVGLGAAALSRSARLAHERQHDALTGLPNRALFIETTEQALDALSRRGGHLAALFIDLDRFKPINDRFGHAVGDALLVAVADRLRASVRSGDTVGRLGGDEFLVLCTDLDGADEAARIAGRIQDAIARPFEISGHALTVGSSIGISVHSVWIEGMDAATLIANADRAMYQAKQSGRGQIASFDTRLTVSV